MNPQSPDITVFMPFYNEESLVEEVVSEGIEDLEKIRDRFELILIDDGSTDRTSEIISSLEDEDSRIRSLHHNNNKGYGRALATGFKEAKGDLVFYTDGDGQFDLSELKKFLEEIGEHDIVVGYRKDRQDNLVRRFIGRSFNHLARMMLPIEEKDIDCAFKLVKKEVIQDTDLETQRTVDAELLAKARSEGYSIKEMPVKHFKRKKGESEAKGLIGVRPTLVTKSLEEIWSIRRSLN